MERQRLEYYNKGTWNLQSVNGLKLPVSQTSDGTTFTILSSTLSISGGNGAGSYSETLRYQTVAGGTTTPGTATEAGTWSATGDLVTFTRQTDRTVYQGSVSGTTLTETVGANTYVYAKQ